MITSTKIPRSLPVEFKWRAKIKSRRKPIHQLMSNSPFRAIRLSMSGDKWKKKSNEAQSQKDIIPSGRRRMWKQSETKLTADVPREDRDTQKVINERLFLIEHHKTMCNFFSYQKFTYVRRHAPLSDRHSRALLSPHTHKKITTPNKQTKNNNNKHYVFIFISYVLFVCLFARRKGNYPKFFTLSFGFW